MTQPVSRRNFLKLMGTAAAGAALAACAPQATATPAVTQAAQSATAPTISLKNKKYTNTKVTFWTQAYGDSAVWQKDYLEAFGAKFKEESGVDTEFQVVPWASANQAWLTVAQGGAAPDAADMYWLYSNAAIGGGKYGPQPMDAYKNDLWPDLTTRYTESALKDGLWNNKFYGLVWRGDIRPMIYRKDLLDAEGIKNPPDTWQEITDMAKQLTKRDSSGNVTQWGFVFGNAQPLQQMLQYLWQAGGEYMTADGKTATIDTPEMHETLQWMYDLIWTHKVVPPELMETSYVVTEQFNAGKIAIVGSASNTTGRDLDRDFPQLDGKWAMKIPAKGPKSRASYFGAGYFGNLYGAKNPEACARWIEFLTRDENMQKIIEYTGYVTPNKSVMASKYWTDRPWKLVVGDTMQYAHPSQHPSPAWTKMVANNAGAVIYDLFYNTLIKKNKIDDEIKTAQKNAQIEMDKIQLS
jgi:multiple sugar transport system substrate-binding protein